MGPFMILGSLALASLLLGKGTKKNQKVKVTIELEGDYKTPNGEGTELDDLTLAEAREDILSVFPTNSWLTINDDIAEIETVGDFYKNQLIPTPMGQIVIMKVEPLSE